MAESSYIRLQNDSGSPVTINEGPEWKCSVVGGTSFSDAYRTKGSLSIPNTEYVDLIFDAEVMWSFESGQIRAAITGGSLTHSLFTNVPPPRYSFQRITGSSATLQASSTFVVSNPSSDTAVTLTLLPGDSHDTGVVIIKDAKGAAATRNITINPDGSETIDGAASLVLSTNNASVTLVWDSTTSDWLIV